MNTPSDDDTLAFTVHFVLRRRGQFLKTFHENNEAYTFSLVSFSLLSNHSLFLLVNHRYNLVAKDEVAYMLDLHLFLGRGVTIAPRPGEVGAGAAAAGDADEHDVPDSTFGSAPQQLLDEGVRANTLVLRKRRHARTQLQPNPLGHTRSLAPSYIHTHARTQIERERSDARRPQPCV